jgi:hypothetical protein
MASLLLPAVPRGQALKYQIRRDEPLDCWDREGQERQALPEKLQAVKPGGEEGDEDRQSLRKV